MSTTTKASRWRVIARSEQGASHIRNKLPNQDAVKFSTSPDGITPVVLAVADGHGSPKSFRSDVGAKFAVESAVSVCCEFLESIRDASASVIKNSAEQQIPRRIIDKWKLSVDQHFTANPFTTGESDLVGKRKYLAYGSTILLAAVSNQFLLFFQLGDGEILVVSDDTGDVSRPIPRNEALIANETTSLCMDDPLPEVRFRFQYVSDLPPGIILLSTDGYPNSFCAQDGFVKVGTDLLEILRTEGGDSVEKDLPGWLCEASIGGSGDDVTLGIIYRLEPRLSRLPVATLPADISPFTTIEQLSELVSTVAMPTEVPDSHGQAPDASNLPATLTAGMEPSGQLAVTSDQVEAADLLPTDELQLGRGQDSATCPGEGDSLTLHEDGAGIAENLLVETTSQPSLKLTNQGAELKGATDTKCSLGHRLNEILKSPFSLFVRKK